MEKKSKKLNKEATSSSPKCILCKKNEQEIWPCNVHGSLEKDKGICRDCSKKEDIAPTRLGMRLDGTTDETRSYGGTHQTEDQKFNKLEKALTLHHMGKGPKHLYKKGRDGVGIYGKNIRTSSFIV